jgi:hypothetical protein
VAYVGLGRDLEVLEVLCLVSYASISLDDKLTLSVESDVSGLDLSLLPSSAFFFSIVQDATNLNIDLVSTKDDRDILTNPLQISVPVRNVLVGDSGSNIKHDDTTLSLDVVTISETTEFLLSSGIPDVEADGTEVGVES